MSVGGGGFSSFFFFLPSSEDLTNRGGGGLLIVFFLMKCQDGRGDWIFFSLLCIFYDRLGEGERREREMDIYITKPVRSGLLTSIMILFFQFFFSLLFSFFSPPTNQREEREDFIQYTKITAEFVELIYIYIYFCV